MNIYNDIQSAPFLQRAVIAVGTFDGVHKAHHVILDNVNRMAKDVNGTSVAISFSVHPRKVINPCHPLQILTTEEEKNILFRQTGLDTVIYIDFTQTISEMSYIDFIKFLTQKMEIKIITVGYDHYFGKNKEGNIPNLKKLKPLFGFDIVEIPKQTLNGIEISSSSIREAINDKNFKLANQLLGYNYKLETQILSRTDKYTLVEPANKDKIIPPNGEYAIKIDGNNACLEIKDRNLYILTENANTPINNSNQNIIIDFNN
ncbi:MAG: FAD synthetase family protein [Bacteroidales bacterium]|nr:FAD synthetase family protein [Bacteroidales bacterium]